MTTTTTRRDGVVEVRVDGRVDVAAIAAFRAALADALAAAAPFAVLFDRRTMTGPTREGRAALDAWAEEQLPSLRDRCAAWCDLFDERRAAVLARAAADAGEPEPDPDEPGWNGYPQRTLTDRDRALAWLHTHLHTHLHAPPEGTP